MSVSEPRVMSGLGRVRSLSLSNSSVSSGFTASLLCLLPGHLAHELSQSLLGSGRVGWRWGGLAGFGGCCCVLRWGSLLSILLVSVAAGKTAGTEPVGRAEGADAPVYPHPDLDCPF